jgi:hypothetical protein
MARIPIVAPHRHFSIAKAATIHSSGWGEGVRHVPVFVQYELGGELTQSAARFFTPTLLR